MAITVQVSGLPPIECEADRVVIADRIEEAVCGDVDALEAIMAFLACVPGDEITVSLALDNDTARQLRDSIRFYCR